MIAYSFSFTDNTMSAAPRIEILQRSRHAMIETPSTRPAINNPAPISRHSFGIGRPVQSSTLL